MSKLQNGLRPGLGTREGVFNLRMKMQNDVYICIIDYTKAFDRVIHSKMIDCLKEVGIDDRACKL